MKPHPVTWETLDWPALDRLREGFLAGGVRGDYWTSPSAVASYDYSHAQRIGWKWDAVLAELRALRWSLPPCDALLDWGCGSGIAGRRVLDACGATRFKRVEFHDRSPLALDFAVRRARELFPDTLVEPVSRESLSRGGPVGLLVVSHVLNELAAAARKELLALARRADAVLWVEPGTHADSRALGAVREELRETFTVIAPCTHQAACGMLSPGNERHWCHHFSEPPRGVRGDHEWVAFARRAGIDLRSLPFSFLVLERTGLRPSRACGIAPAGCARLLGGARFYKGFAKLVVCRQEGVRDIELQKRDAPAVFKSLKDGEAPPLWRLDVVGNRIKRCEPALTSPPGRGPSDTPGASAP